MHCSERASGGVAGDPGPSAHDDVTVDAMRDRMAEGSEAFANGLFKHRGTNGRWRDTLTDDDLALYDRKAAQVLEPSCRAWLEDLP